MQNKSDAELLREYAENGAEAAFAEIVARHTNLVYSAALRQLNSPDAAAEAAQRVFIGLAQGSRQLSRRLAPGASLAGWLCRSVRNVSLNYRRDEFRRQSRERLAMQDLNAAAEEKPDWEGLCAVLDDAMADLNEADYDAIVMRFFKNQDLRSVGRALGVSDDTAQKRVSRALEKLRESFGRHGVATTAAALSLALSAKAVEAAPAGLAAGILTAATVAHTTVNTSTAITITKSILMTTVQKTLVAAALATAVGTGIYEARRASSLEAQTAALRSEHDALARQLQDAREDASRKLEVARQQADAPDGQREVMKLRAQVARLRDELSRAKAAAPVAGQDPTSAEMTSWLQRVKTLKDKLAQNPKLTIPEFQLLTDQDWLDAVRGVKQLKDDGDFSKAWGQLRDAARHEFANTLQGAFHAYAQANNGALPSDFSQLQTYFDKPVDDSILQGYDFSQPGTVVSRSESLIDKTGNYLSWKMQVGMDSVSM